MSVLQQVLILLSNLTLRRWSSASEDGEDKSLHFLLVYGGFCLLGTLAGLISALLIWVFCGLKSARHLHDQMLNALLHAPLSFFQLNPTGRTLNLFTKDTNVLDQVIPRVIQGTCSNLDLGWCSTTL
jgi:ATP-binding cassette subfamily C (CFTR/MRP) protein 1